MGLRGENRTAVEELPIVEPARKDDVIEEMMRKSITEVSMGGCVLWPRPDWELIAEKTPTSALRRIEEGSRQDPCSPEKNLPIS
jgi:hypothetical protein